MMSNYKIGELLTAKDACTMETGEDTLTIGRLYEVVKVYDIGLTVIDDDNDEHDFWFSIIDDFFDRNISKVLK